MSYKLVDLRIEQPQESGARARVRARLLLQPEVSPIHGPEIRDIGPVKVSIDVHPEKLPERGFVSMEAWLAWLLRVSVDSNPFG